MDLHRMMLSNVKRIPIGLPCSLNNTGKKIQLCYYNPLYDLNFFGITCESITVTVDSSLPTV